MAGNNWEEQLDELLDFAVHKLSDIEPDEWAEQNMHIRDGNFQGPLSYDLNPYFRYIIKCLSPYHPATEIVLMGPAQIGKSKVLIEAAIAYYISEHPCNILYLTGHSELSEEAMMKLDNAIDSAGLRPLIFKQTLSKKNTQTGDTKQRKEFPLGTLISGSATNHKLLRQRDPKFVIADDIEAANKASNKSGSTVALIRKRTNSYGNKKKILWVSTPELAATSIIRDLYFQGDMNVFEIPCQCCGAMIEMKWENFTWGWEDGRLVPGSVMYICQVCGDQFDDSNKREFLLAGRFRPTRIPDNPTVVSFSLAGWLAGAGMDNWEAIVREYLLACPPGQTPDKSLLQTWTNLTKGDVYEDNFEELNANVLQKNIGGYEIDTIPEKLSVKNGNGKIVLLTCAADLNGVLENGRLDYEVVAHAENGSTYSIRHGSIGTFVPAILKSKKDKEEEGLKDWWTYEENKPLSIFAEFEKVLHINFIVDVCDGELPRHMNIGITAVDTGYFKTHAFTFIEKMVNKGIFVQGVKGKGDEEYDIFTEGLNSTEIDRRVITKGKEMENLWTLEVGFIKDRMVTLMNMKWNPQKGEIQPSGFMNFPHPSKGMYEWTNFFEHFQSEKRVLVANKAGTNVKAKWEKKKTNSQNHQWDCRVYNLAIKDIWVLILKEKYGKETTWNTYVEATLRLRSQKLAA